MFNNLQKTVAKNTFSTKKPVVATEQKNKNPIRKNTRDASAVIVTAKTTDKSAPRSILNIRSLRPSSALPVQAIASISKTDLTDTFVAFDRKKTQQQAKALKSRESEVKKHEAAHILAGTGVTSGLSYTYQQASDGSSYAIGGEVTVNMQEGSTPEETIQKAQKMKAAALAPSNPSAQDQDLAVMAMKMEANARQERAEKQKEAQEKLKETAEKFQEVAEEMLAGPATSPFTDLSNPMKNVGDPTYIPLETDIVSPVPTSSVTGERLVTADPKESEHKLVYQEQKFKFRPVTDSSVDPKHTKQATTQRKLNKPKMVAFGKKLKTNSKPIIYTSEIDTYKSIEKVLKKEDMSHKVDLVLTSKTRIDSIQGTTKSLAVDSNLGRNLNRLLAVV